MSDVLRRLSELAKELEALSQSLSPGQEVQKKTEDLRQQIEEEKNEIIREIKRDREDNS